MTSIWQTSLSCQWTEDQRITYPLWSQYCSVKCPWYRWQFDCPHCYTGFPSITKNCKLHQYIFMNQWWWFRIPSGGPMHDTCIENCPSCHSNQLNVFLWSLLSTDIWHRHFGSWSIVAKLFLKSQKWHMLMKCFNFTKTLVLLIKIFYFLNWFWHMPLTGRITVQLEIVYLTLGEVKMPHQSNRVLTEPGTLPDQLRLESIWTDLLSISITRTAWKHLSLDELSCNLFRPINQQRCIVCWTAQMGSLWYTQMMGSFMVVSMAILPEVFKVTINQVVI